MNLIKTNAANVLTALVEHGNEEVAPPGYLLQNWTSLEPQNINEAVDHLEELKAVEVIRGGLNVPYSFRNVKVTAAGKFLYEERSRHGARGLVDAMALDKERPAVPPGSPYGFEDEDWKFVLSQKQDRSTLNVVLGLQWESNYYITNDLAQNVEGHFEHGLKAFNDRTGSDRACLRFEKLSAGYGQHLFNRIARDIIGSDIAVFEISDQNPNVMIEIGVALTWGVQVFLLREMTSKKNPPSNVSGQTWVWYKESAKQLLDDDSATKIEEMIELALSKK